MSGREKIFLALFHRKLDLLTDFVEHEYGRDVVEDAEQLEHVLVYGLACESGRHVLDNHQEVGTSAAVAYKDTLLHYQFQA